MGNLCFKNNKNNSYNDHISSFPDELIFKKLDILDFTFENKENETLIRNSGSINGQQFIIKDCKDCNIYLLDYSAQVTISRCTTCQIFVGPCESSIFIRNCQQCQFIVACQQLRMKDCQELNILTFCSTSPSMENSHGIKFGCFDYYYPEISEHFTSAKLSVWNNFWYQIYDFSNQNPSIDNCSDSFYKDSTFSSLENKNTNFSFISDDINFKHHNPNQQNSIDIVVPYTIGTQNIKKIDLEQSKYQDIFFCSDNETCLHLLSQIIKKSYIYKTKEIKLNPNQIRLLPLSLHNIATQTTFVGLYLCLFHEDINNIKSNISLMLIDEPSAIIKWNQQWFEEF